MSHEEFTKCLIELMRLKGLDQKDLAKLLGVSEMSVSRWIAAKIYPGQPTKMLVSRLLDDVRREVLADLQKKLGQQMITVLPSPVANSKSVDR